MRYITVAQVAEIPPGKTQMVEVEHTLILLVNDGGQLYALQGLCLHQNLPLAGGTV